MRGAKMTYLGKKKYSQKNIILEYLKQNKKITSWDAIQDFGITRLAGVIHSLRKEGYVIDKVMKTKKNNRTGKISTYATYIYVNSVDIGSNYELCLG
jgi:hypothetical protein